MAIMFVLGFFLDTFEIIFITVPITAPIILMMGVDPILLGVLIGLVLQTSFLTPPFGFSLFYLRGVAPPSITTGMIYQGIIAFVVMQLLVLVAVWSYPKLATGLPNYLFRATRSSRTARRRRPRSISTNPKPTGAEQARQQCEKAGLGPAFFVSAICKRKGDRALARSPHAPSRSGQAEVGNLNCSVRALRNACSLKRRWRIVLSREAR